LAFDTSTAVITGTPTTITASSEIGSASANLVLKVTDAVPVTSYSPPPIPVVGGSPITTLTPVRTGGSCCRMIRRRPLQ
jgi:hypothetical protein